MILHILRNDFRCLRTWLITWVLVLAIPVLLFLGLRAGFGWSVGYWGFLRIAIMLVVLLEMLTAFLLIARLIQKEDLCNPQSYWLSRPISRMHLALAKLCGLVLIVCVPFILQGALLGALYPGGLDAMVHGAMAMGLMGLILCFLSMIGASVTRDGGTALLAVFLVAILAAASGWLLVRIPGVATLSQDLIALLSRIAYVDTILQAVAAVLILSVFFWQYHRPCRKYRAGVLYCLLIGVVMFAGKIIPLPSLPESTVSLPEKAQLELIRIYYSRSDRPFPGASSTSSGSLDVWWGGNAGSYRELSAQLQWLGLSEQHVVATEPYRSIAPGGSILLPPRKTWHRGSNQRVTLPDSLKRTILSGYESGRIRYDGIVSKDLFAAPLLGLSATDLPAEFTTTFVTRFYQPEVVRLPVDSRLRMDIGTARVQLQSVESLGGKLELSFSYLSDGASDDFWDESVEGGFLAVRDPDTGHVVFAERRGSSSSRFLGILSAGEFEIILDGSWLDASDLDQLEWYHVRLIPDGVTVHDVSYLVGEPGE